MCRLPVVASPCSEGNVSQVNESVTGQAVWWQLARLELARAVNVGIERSNYRAMETINRLYEVTTSRAAGVERRSFSCVPNENLGQAVTGEEEVQPHQEFDMLW